MRVEWIGAARLQTRVDDDRQDHAAQDIVALHFDSAYPTFAALIWLAGRMFLSK